MRHRPTINPLALTPIEPRYWPCGTCRAESGEICRTATGNPATSHVDRYRSVQRWQRYGQAWAKDLCSCGADPAASAFVNWDSNCERHLAGAR